MVWALGVLQALNQLFEKIMALDIDERHLLRLGHGEEELATDKDFSRWVCPVGVVIYRHSSTLHQNALSTGHSTSVELSNCYIEG